MSRAGAIATLGVVWMVAATLVTVTIPFGVPWWYNAVFFLIGFCLFLLAFPARKAEDWWHRNFD